MKKDKYPIKCKKCDYSSKPEKIGTKMFIFCSDYQVFIPSLSAFGKCKNYKEKEVK